MQKLAEVTVLVMFIIVIFSFHRYPIGIAYAYVHWSNLDLGVNMQNGLYLSLSFKDGCLAYLLTHSRGKGY